MLFVTLAPWFPSPEPDNHNRGSFALWSKIQMPQLHSLLFKPSLSKGNRTILAPGRAGILTDHP